MNNGKFRFLKPKEKKGLIVVLTGHGKGKTTSALGMILRAAGYDMSVCIIHFMKGDMYAGEIDGIKKLASNVEDHLCGKGFCRIGNDSYPYQEHQAKAQEAIKLAEEKMLSGKFDIVILDEINNALKMGLVNLSQVLDLLKNKPPLMHFILTGRDAHPEVIKRAHTVTEMKVIKHALQEGIDPQKGIDY